MKRNVILYQEIAEKIKKRILSGVYPVGSYIPSEIALETNFQVSKITIRQAVSLLASEGYLEKRRGKGTIVISNQLFGKLSKAKSFSTILKEAEFTVTKKILEVSAVPAEDPLVEACRFDCDITYIKRMYYLNDSPYIIYRHYLRGTAPLTDENSESNKLVKISLYQLLKENNQIITSFDDTFTVAELSPEEQNLLSTKVKTGLERTRKSFDDRGRLVELSRGLYNTTIFPYKIKYEV